MFRQVSSYCVSLSFILLFSVQANLQAQAIAQWDFEGSLEATTQNLELIGEFATPAFEPVFDFEEKEIDGDFAEACRFEQGTYFRLTHGFGPNAGGAYVNQYTLIMDVMYPEAFGKDDPDGFLGTAGWQGLYQTNESNTNDGDWFVNPAGGVGISGNYGGSVPDGQWHRLALSVDLVAGTYTSYVNGERVQQNTGQTVDGRFSLGETILIFADENGETAGGYVSSIQLRDAAMTDAELAAFGGATAAGIPLPECIGPRCCLNRQFRANYIADSNAVVCSWASLEGDESFRVLRNGEPVSEALTGDTVSFEDRDPPTGGVDVEYVLQHLQGEVVEVACSGSVNTFDCPDRLDCRVDQAVSTVDLSWGAGVNLPVSGFTVSRDGEAIAELEAGALSYTDTVAGAGRYNYTVSILSEDGVVCDDALSCLAIVTGIDLGPGVDGLLNQYDFNGDLTSSTGGADLIAIASLPLDPAFDEPEVIFEDADIGGEEAEVAFYSRGTYFRLFTGFPPNGGGNYTNQYTLIMDVMFPEGSLLESGWAAFYNTNPPASNDGDWFLQGANRGIGISGNYGGTVLPDTWHRLALVVDLVEGTYTSYIDGTQVQQNTGEGLDGRFSLYSINDGESEGISIFADDSGDSASGYVNSVQIRDVAMPAGEIAALGGPTADGIPVLAEYTCPMALQCCVDRETGEVSLSWAGGAGMEGLELFRDGESIGAIAGDAASFSDTDAGPGSHVYEIRSTGEENCGNLPLVCQALIFDVGDSILYEGFDCYRTDEDLAAAGWESVEVNEPLEDQRWTVTNPSSRANPPSANGMPTTGGFVISEYAAASLDAPGSGVSHDLWSPVFSAADHEEVWLHMDASVQLNNNGDAIFDVDVSVDDGTTWNNVFRRIAPARMVEPLPSLELENADGAFGRLHIDLSEFAAGEEAVRFRLRHFEPTWDWWIAVDNVLVDSKAPGGSIEVLPLADFGDEAVPDDWDVYSGDESDGLRPWNVDDICAVSLLNAGIGFPDMADGRQLHHFDEFFAMADPVCTGDIMDEYMSLPPMDCSDYEEVFLHVRSAIMASDSTLAEILLSLDGGETWEEEPIFTYSGGALSDPEEDPYYNEFIFELPRAAGQEDVSIAFHYSTLSLPGVQAWWAIDDVAVTANGGEGPGPGPGGGQEFIRGDADDNGSLQLTDGIFILNFLFLGGGTPGCTESADADNNGSIQLTDGIFILNFLFLGGDATPAPGALACGLDPDEAGTFLDSGCEDYSSCP